VDRAAVEAGENASVLDEELKSSGTLSEPPAESSRGTPTEVAFAASLVPVPAEVIATVSPSISFDAESLLSLPKRSPSLHLSLSDSPASSNDQLFPPPPSLTLQSSLSEIVYRSPSPDDPPPPAQLKLQSSLSATSWAPRQQRRGLTSEFKSLMAEKLMKKRELMRMKILAAEAGKFMTEVTEAKVRRDSEAVAYQPVVESVQDACPVTSSSEQDQIEGPRVDEPMMSTQPSDDGDDTRSVSRMNPEADLENIVLFKEQADRVAKLYEDLDQIPVPLRDSGRSPIVSLALSRASADSDHLSLELDARMTKLAQEEADKWDIATYETLDALRAPSLSRRNSVVNGQFRQSLSEAVGGGSLTGPRRYAGWLCKQSEYLQNWNKRYFVLESCVLLYYYNTHSLGHSYDLTQQTQLIATVHSQPLCFRLTNTTEGNQWDLLLKCEDQSMKQEWVWRLQDHLQWLTRPPTEQHQQSLGILAEEEGEEEEGEGGVEDARSSAGMILPPPSATSSPRKKRSIPYLPPDEAAISLSQLGAQKGWAQKEGTILWNPRYLILSNARLMYYLSDSPSELDTPRGTYVFTPKTQLSTPTTDSSLGDNTIALRDVSGGWSVVLKFENEEIVEEWVRVISIHLMFISV
jgi:hypothetical protein